MFNAPGRWSVYLCYAQPEAQHEAAALATALGQSRVWLDVFAVRQWPLVLANVSASAAKESFAPDDARALPPSSYVFAHGMEPGQYIVLDSGEALHTGARIEGVATDVPRAAVVFDYECRRHDGAVV